MTLDMNEAWRATILLRLQTLTPDEKQGALLATEFSNGGLARVFLREGSIAVMRDHPLLDLLDAQGHFRPEERSFINTVLKAEPLDISLALR